MPAKYWISISLIINFSREIFALFFFQSPAVVKHKKDIVREAKGKGKKNTKSWLDNINERQRIMTAPWIF